MGCGHLAPPCQRGAGGKSRPVVSAAGGSGRPYPTHRKRINTPTQASVSLQLRAKGTTPFEGRFFSTTSVGAGRGTMTENHPTEIVCADCGSGYKVVRAEADADLPHRLIHCWVCKHPLTAMD